MSALFPPQIAVAGGQAATVVGDALWVENLAVGEAAEAMRRPAEWVEGVAAGEVDPTLDELEVAVNAIGLETRVHVGLPDRRWPPAARSRQQVADNVAALRDHDMRAYGRIWVQRGPPQPGAEARLFSAGPGRTDGGGRAAILARNTLASLGVTAGQIAARAGIAADEAAELAGGGWRPAAGEFERILAACGVPMLISLDEYDFGDDERHAAWEADPAGYEARIAAIRCEVQSWQLAPST